MRREGWISHHPSSLLSSLGQISSLLLFSFAGVRIARSLKAVVVSPDLASLGPSSPYCGGRGRGRGKWQRNQFHNLVPGEKPVR